MHFLQTFLQTLLALAATVHGAPKIHKDPKDATTLITPPKYKCGHTTKLVMSRYMFEGTAWSVHEMEILNAIKKAQPTCTVTNWRYREETGLDGLTNFQAVFEEPRGCQKKVQKVINKVFDFKSAKDGGIKCPDLGKTGGREIDALHAELGPRRGAPYGKDDDE